MKIDVLQHVLYEGPGAISEWAQSQGHEIRITEVYQADLPAVDGIEFLVILGGPMNVHQEADYPWLAKERAFIKAAIEKGKVVLGICLGAQLLADALGGKVTKGEHVEIGWFPVEITDDGHELELMDGFPTRFIALHWHGDTFSIPPDSVHFASSTACKHQAFAYDEGRVVGLQFHCEETRESLALLMENAAADLVQGEWIETPKELLAPYAPFQLGHDLLYRLLDRMAEKASA
jgi:GMP synthase-like glutamine amidotransferase